MFNSATELEIFINGLDDTTPKWSIVEFETKEVINGCESMTDKAAYVWIMENQPTSEIPGEGIRKYDFTAIDSNNCNMPWFDSE